MTTKVKELLRQLLDLSVEERHELISEVWRTEDEEFGAPPSLYPNEAAWEAELQRRINSIADGTAELIPWDQAREQIRDELARRRAAREGEASS